MQRRYWTFYEAINFAYPQYWLEEGANFYRKIYIGKKLVCQTLTGTGVLAL